MKLIYDPGDEDFWEQVASIPGYPADEEIRLKHMIFESGAYRRIGERLRAAGADNSRPILVIMDPTPMMREGVSLKPLILSQLETEGWQPVKVVIPPDGSGQIHAGMETISFVKERIRPGVSVLSVGSGSVTDITKHACFLYEQENGETIPLVAYQTANSVTAFTSSMAVLFMHGVKRTVASRYPDALVCDLETLRDAPYEMTAGGVGDLLAVFVSYPDWYLAYRLGLDGTYSEFALQLLGPVDDILKNEAEGISGGDLASVSILAKCIALAGIAMSLAHATTPLSGFEHVISHVLDMQAEVEHRPLAVHGTQVALATMIGVEVYRLFAEDFEPSHVVLDDCYPEPEEMRLVIEQAFSGIDPSGKVAEECYSDFRQKLEAWNASRHMHQDVLNEWGEFRVRMLRDTRSLETLVEILKAVRSPLKWSQLTPPITEEQVKFAFMNANLMRKRLTIGDLLFFFQWDRDALWHQVWTRTQNLVLA